MNSIVNTCPRCGTQNGFTWSGDGKITSRDTGEEIADNISICFDCVTVDDL